MRLGYTRVSTEGQTIDLQKDALKRFRWSEVYQEHATGKIQRAPAWSLPQELARRRYVCGVAAGPAGRKPGRLGPAHR